LFSRCCSSDTALLCYLSDPNCISLVLGALLIAEHSEWLLHGSGSLQLVTLSLFYKRQSFELLFIFQISLYHSIALTVGLNYYNCYNHFTALGTVRDNPGEQVRSNIHAFTPIVVINHPLSASSSFCDPWHPPCSIYMPDSLSTISLQVFFGLLLGLAPSTSYSIYFFTQSLSSFHNTCPFYGSLFCCSTEIMSSNPSLPFNPLLGTLSCNFTSHIHVTILISAL